MRNDKLIPSSAFLVVIMGSVASVKRTNALPGINFWLGVAIAYLFISLVDEVEPDIGGGLAILVLVSAAFGYGEDVAGYAADRTGGKIGQAVIPPTAREKRQARREAIDAERIV